MAGPATRGGSQSGSATNSLTPGGLSPGASSKMSSIPLQSHSLGGCSAEVVLVNIGMWWISCSRISDSIQQNSSLSQTPWRQRVRLPWHRWVMFPGLFISPCFVPSFSQDNYQWSFSHPIIPSMSFSVPYSCGFLPPKEFWYTPETFKTSWPQWSIQRLPRYLKCTLLASADDWMEKMDLSILLSYASEWIDCFDWAS